MFTKYVPLPSDDVQFIKQVPLHPRERLKRTIAARLKNKKLPPLLHPREQLKQKAAKLEKQLKQTEAQLEDELKIIKVVPSLPRDRLQRRIKALEGELVFIRQVHSHPRDRLKKRVNELENKKKLLSRYLYILGKDLNVRLQP